VLKELLNDKLKLEFIDCCPFIGYLGYSVAWEKGVS